MPDNPWNIEVNEIKHLEWYLERRLQESRWNNNKNYLLQKDKQDKDLQYLKPCTSSNSGTDQCSGLSRSNTNTSRLSGKSNSFRKALEARRLRRSSSDNSSQPIDLFQNKVINVIVPGTVSIHSCHNCGGVGRKRCIVCAGSGTVR